MLVGVQWTLASPQDWTWIDVKPTGAAARLWERLPKKPVPTGGEVIDQTLGYIFDVCIQGVYLYGFDHLALEPLPGGGVRAYGWVDDTDDPTFQYRWGEVWEFRPGWVDRTVKITGDGQVRHRGPDQRKTVYAEDLADMARFVPAECGGLPVELKPWSGFPTPPVNITAHGIWVHDQTLWQRHFDVRRPVDWREWVT